MSGCHCEAQDGQGPQSDTGTQGPSAAEVGKGQTHRGVDHGDIVDLMCDTSVTLAPYSFIIVVLHNTSKSLLLIILSIVHLVLLIQEGINYIPCLKMKPLVI